MDPNETLRLIDEALADDMPDEAAEYAEVLGDWLNRGGFAPDWGAHPKAWAFCASTCPVHRWDATKDEAVRPRPVLRPGDNGWSRVGPGRPA